jgi:hypothetical protein
MRAADALCVVYHFILNIFYILFTQTFNHNCKRDLEILWIRTQQRYDVWKDNQKIVLTKYEDDTCTETRRGND